MNIEHRTSNRFDKLKALSLPKGIEHRTQRTALRATGLRSFPTSMFDVRCSMFDVRLSP